MPTRKGRQSSAWHCSPDAKKGTDCNAIQRPTSSDMDNTDRAKTVQKPCSHGLQNKKAMKSFDFTAFSGAMEGTRTPGLLIRSQSLYPAELPTHTFRSEQDVFYHAGRGLSTVFCRFFDFIFVFYFSAQKSTSFRFFQYSS